MHVLQLCSGRAVNGAVIHCWMLSHELRRLGHQVTIACRPQSWMAEQASAAGFETITTDFAKFSTVQLREAARQVRLRGVEVMHSHQSSASCFAVVLRWMTGTPSVATAHSRYLQLHWMWNDFVIGVSDSTTDYHRRVNLVAKQNSATVHNFVDWERFKNPDPQARQRLREEWRATPDQLLFGPVGDVIARKGMIHLVRSVPADLVPAPRSATPLRGRPRQGSQVLAASAKRSPPFAGGRSCDLGRRPFRYP